MKKCPNCGTVSNDKFCRTCGMDLRGVEDESSYRNNTGYNYSNNATEPSGTIYYDTTDHTNEFDPKDIAENKVIAMVAYWFGFVGIIIAMLANESPFARFHAKQLMKATLLGVWISILLCISIGIMSITYNGAFSIFLTIVFSVALLIDAILTIIGFVYACQGRGKELPIICNIKFLK